MIPSTPKLKPIRFLSRIMHQTPQVITTTEEIYEEETKEFCTRMNFKTVSSTNSPLPLRLTDSPASNKKNVCSFSPSHSSKEKHKIRLCSKNRSPEHSSLPPISIKTPVLDKFSVKYPSKSKDKYSISKILQVYESGIEKSSTTKSLKSSILKNSMIAKEYAKEIDWTSGQLEEISGFEKDMMKRIFKDLKISKEIYDEDIKNIVADYSQKLVLGKNYRVNARKSKLFKRKMV